MIVMHFSFYDSDLFSERFFWRHDTSQKETGFEGGP